MSYSLSKGSVEVFTAGFSYFLLIVLQSKVGLESLCRDKILASCLTNKSCSLIPVYNTVGILTEMRAFVVYRPTGPSGFATFFLCHTLWVEWINAEVVALQHIQFIGL